MSVMSHISVASRSQSAGSRNSVSRTHNNSRRQVLKDLEDASASLKHAAPGLQGAWVSLPTPEISKVSFVHVAPSTCLLSSLSIQHAEKSTVHTFESMAIWVITFFEALIRNSHPTANPVLWADRVGEKVNLACKLGCAEAGGENFLVELKNNYSKSLIIQIQCEFRHFFWI